MVGGSKLTVSEIIKALRNLPNFLYVYWGKDNKDHMVILGERPCPKKNEYIGTIDCYHANVDMMKLYEKDTLEEADKYQLVRLMRCIQSLCDYRYEELYSLEQQTEYLNGLSSEQLEEIYKQIEMYKFARSLYSEYH